MITALGEGAGLTCHCSLLWTKGVQQNRAPLTLQEVWKTLEKYRPSGVADPNTSAYPGCTRNWWYL